MKNLIAESWNAAVLDSSAGKTICGQSWLDCYIESLNKSDKSKVSYNEASNFYHFGDGKRVCSMKSVKLPAVIGQQPVTTESDVVYCDVPLLMCRSSMKRANMHLNFENDTANTFSQDINLIVTKSGHYAIPLTVPRKLLHEFERNGSVNITLSSKHSTSKTAIANKLHCQFTHPPPEKLLCLLNSAGDPWSEDEELKNEIKLISKNCLTCKLYKKPAHKKPTVGLPNASRFQELVATDLKFYKGKIILHLVDHATRLSLSSLVPSKKPDVIIKSILKNWISVFGSADQFLSMVVSLQMKNSWKCVKVSTSTSKPRVLSLLGQMA